MACQSGRRAYHFHTMKPRLKIDFVAHPERDDLKSYRPFRRGTYLFPQYSEFFDAFRKFFYFDSLLGSTDGTDYPFLHFLTCFVSSISHGFSADVAKLVGNVILYLSSQFLKYIRSNSRNNDRR